MVFLVFFAASESESLDALAAAHAPAVQPLLLLLRLLSYQYPPQSSICPNIPK
jgi:hypothetical protein